MSWAENVDLSNKVGQGTYVVGAMGKDKEIIAQGSQNKEINITGENDTAYNVLAYVGGQITLGDQNTQNVNISTTGTNAYGMMSLYGGSKITVNGDTLTINAKGTDYAIGLQAQSNSQEPAAKIDINTKNTVINASTDAHEPVKGEYPAIGIIAYSGSQVNINNNLTVNAPTAISTRGLATININQGGKGTVKMNGDISFDYDDKTSGTTIDSNVNINLTNKDSYSEG